MPWLSKKKQEEPIGQQGLILPEIKNIVSIDLGDGELPANIEDCAICCDVDIGIKGKEGADIFQVTIVTPKFLAHDVREEGYRWGKGYLIVDSFSWEAVERALEQLLSQSSGSSWIEVAKKLNKVLDWEFANLEE